MAYRKIPTVSHSQCPYNKQCILAALHNVPHLHHQHISICTFSNQIIIVANVDMARVGRVQINSRLKLGQFELSGCCQVDISVSSNISEKKYLGQKISQTKNILNQKYLGQKNTNYLRQFVSFKYCRLLRRRKVY